MLSLIPGYDMTEVSIKTKTETQGYSPLKQFWRRFRRNRLAIVALGFITFLSVIALLWSGDPVSPDQAKTLFPLLKPIDTVRRTPYAPSETALGDMLQPPSQKHPFGTDKIGRDILARMLHGTRISLTVGFVAVFISLTIGITVGACAGYFGKWVDTVLMRIVDIMMNFPSFLLVITIVALLDKPSYWWIILVIGLTGWTGTARFVRAEFLSLRQQDFVGAVRALGAGHARIMFTHMLPTGVAPVLVSATLGVAGAILTEAGLSFLGFGVQPPQPTWGNILAEGRDVFDAWWLTVFPGVAVLLTVLAFNLLGEGLRDALNPRLSER